MNWTAEQKQIIDSRNGNLLVSAAAGSGKTAVLVERIIQMILEKNNPIDIDQLLVVTFTKAAAAQMKEKIISAIEKKLEQEPENEHLVKQMNLVNRANILTIDSFCYKVVKEHFYVLGLDPNIRVGDSGEMGLLKEEVLSNVIEEFYEKNKDFSLFSDVFSADKNDQNMESYLLKVYDICCSYPRPSEWIWQAKNSLVVEDETEFVELPIVKLYFDEIHAMAEGIREKILFCLERCRQIDGPIHLESAFLSDVQLVDDMISANKYTHFHDLLSCSFARIGRGKKGTYDEELAEELKKIRENYKKEIRGLLSVFEVPFQNVLSQMKLQAPMLLAFLDAVELFRVRFLEKKFEKNILEFSDVEHCALQVLCNDYDEEGNALPSEIGKEIASQFYEIMIDEYQDSNYLQEAILRCVSTVPEGKNNIFMVGDVKQSIYRFRMARPDLFMNKYQTYSFEEGSENRKLLLTRNFRSRHQILDGINYLFYQIMGRDLGGIEYSKEEALVAGREFPDATDSGIEILLGETKDFDYLNSDEEEETGTEEEILDDNLEEIGKKELEATMVAERILRMMGTTNSSFQVVDEETGNLRDIRYSDIVILFRAPSGYQQIFCETLMAKGIPVHIQNENSYFDTMEISLMLSLLRVIDNPYNDVELAAVLRSYFGGCNNNALAWLVMVKRGMERQDAKKKKLYFYDAIKQLIQLKQKNELYDYLVQQEMMIDTIDAMEIVKKCECFIDMIITFQEKIVIHGISELLSDIYYEKGYYYYVKGMPEGKRRSKNLDVLLEEAVRLETDVFCSLFDFLKYMEKLQKKSIVLDGEPGIDTTENVVRMMSIHKSKGLEFPVVFLSGIGKNFNQMDTKTPLIVHSDYYLGAKYRNPENRCGNDTFLRKAMVALMTTENIAEELRLLYVGMTRAKEKLILSGVTSDIPALIKRYEDIGKREEEKLSFSNVHTAHSYLHLIVMGLMRNPDFETAIKNVRKRMDKKGENIISAEYERTITLDRTIDIKVQIFDFMDLLVHHMKSNLEKEEERAKELEDWKMKDAGIKEDLQKALHWIYEKNEFTLQKSKLSVTEIKRIYETDFEPSDVIQTESSKEYKPPLPRFIQGEIPMEAARRGTWVHKTMELFDFARDYTKEQVKESFLEMIAEGRIPDEVKTFFSPEQIEKLLQSSLGKRMQIAAKQGLLSKEKQFIIGVPAKKVMQKQCSEIWTEESEDERILVQGIIDVYFQEDGELVLIDYKTDTIKPGEEEKLVKRYATQLYYYKDTLEQLTGLKVKESYIYSFALNRAIEII